MAEVVSPRNKWINSLGFSEMPFKMPVAEDEPNLGQLFMAPYFFDSLIESKSVFVFGGRGRGKSVLRMETALRLQDQPSAFVIQYTPSDALIENNSVSSNRQETDVINTVRQASFQNPSEPNLRKLYKALRRDTTTVNKIDSLNSLYALLGNFGFNSVHLLIDSTDLLVETAGNAEMQMQILKPFLRSMDKEKPINQYLKCFLPVELKPFFDEQRREMYTIEWSLEDLYNLVNSRLSFFSDNQIADFFQLSGNSGERPFTTQELVDTLTNIVGIRSPRLTLRVAKEVFEEHFEREGPHGILNEIDLEKAIAKMIRK